MARGWESKSVESQQDNAPGADRGAELTREQREAWKKRQSLESSRSRVVQEIAATPSAARRSALEQALAFLDEEIGKLGPA